LPLVQVLARPSFHPIWARVLHVSPIQLDLRCPRAFAPGTVLALPWLFGPPRLWRTLLARVEGAESGTGQSWLIRGRLDSPLPAACVQAFLRMAQAQSAF
jgi:hypothetical protein